MTKLYVFALIVVLLLPGMALAQTDTPTPTPTPTATATPSPTPDILYSYDLESGKTGVVELAVSTGEYVIGVFEFVQILLLFLILVAVNRLERAK